MNTVSIARSATAAIFAAVAGMGYAQTGWHPSAQSDRSIAAPGATSGELKTPRPSQSSTSGMSGAAASDPGIPDTGRTRSVQGAHDRNTPATRPKTDQGNVH
ncbi:hypothetical protein PPMP20_15325 [Paraburkholderia phymatum]|uniref:Lipoprotein n=1 Tax=Paraburkholderia phymatum (strain DSM 17167 / CIP 108236 / LMG 21445 / STM815) TaxID=391038 RepID=B2JPV0_PARP8|nr:hypothetical protein [Paraburkholderia phymatum]ACC73291.1 hypothetical protein Bphy_4170 [Paraburkholderia phymatum STM815]